MKSIFDGSVGHAKNVSLGLGIIGFCGCLIGWFVAPRDFFVAYLFGHFFFLGLSLGSLALLMIHHLTAGDWGYAVRRFLESAVGHLPLLALLFVPIFFGLAQLYPWQNPTVVAANETLRVTQMYLNPPGFVLRTAIVFAIWIIMGRQLLKWSAEQDATVSLAPTRKMRTLSGPGLVIYPITMTFAAVDWLMSMEADWISTMFPVLICIGQVLSALALVILLLAWAARSSPLGPLANEKNFHKLGNLLLAFTMMWAYLAFGQLLVICFFFQAEDGIRDLTVTGVQTCALPIYTSSFPAPTPLLDRRQGRSQRRPHCRFRPSIVSRDVRRRRASR